MLFSIRLLKHFFNFLKPRNLRGFFVLKCFKSWTIDKKSIQWRIFFIIVKLNNYWVMREIPKELLSLKIYDGRPAYIFADRKTGKFPLGEFCCDRSTCPYCGEKLISGDCACYSYKKVKEYNATLSK